jgi:hypothetical protein
MPTVWELSPLRGCAELRRKGSPTPAMRECDAAPPQRVVVACLGMKHAARRFIPRSAAPQRHFPVRSVSDSAPALPLVHPRKNRNARRTPAAEHDHHDQSPH